MEELLLYVYQIKVCFLSAS